MAEAASLQSQIDFLTNLISSHKANQGQRQVHHGQPHKKKKKSVPLSTYKVRNTPAVMLSESQTTLTQKTGVQLNNESGIMSKRSANGINISQRNYTGPTQNGQKDARKSIQSISSLPIPQKVNTYASHIATSTNPMRSDCSVNRCKVNNTKVATQSVKPKSGPPERVSSAKCVQKTKSHDSTVKTTTARTQATTARVQAQNHNISGTQTHESVATQSVKPKCGLPERVSSTECVQKTTSQGSTVKTTTVQVQAQKDNISKRQTHESPSKDKLVKAKISLEIQRATCDKLAILERKHRAAIIARQLLRGRTKEAISDISAPSECSLRMSPTKRRLENEGSPVCQEKKYKWTNTNMPKAQATSPPDHNAYTNLPSTTADADTRYSANSKKNIVSTKYKLVKKQQPASIMPTTRQALRFATPKTTHQDVKRGRKSVTPSEKISSRATRGREASPRSTQTLGTSAPNRFKVDRRNIGASNTSAAPSVPPNVPGPSKVVSLHSVGTTLPSRRSERMTPLPSMPSGVKSVKLLSRYKLVKKAIEVSSSKSRRAAATSSATPNAKLVQTSAFSLRLRILTARKARSLAMPQSDAQRAITASGTAYQVPPRRPKGQRQTSWTRKYSIKRDDKEKSATPSEVDINRLLGRNVVNLSKSQFKFIHPTSHRRGAAATRAVAARTARVAPKNRLKLDRRPQEQRVRRNLGTGWPVRRRGGKLVHIAGTTYQSTRRSLVRTGQMTLQRKVFPESRVSAMVQRKRTAQILASRAVQKSLVHSWRRNTRQAKRDPAKQYCLNYRRFGRCHRGTGCQFIHDPKRIALCTRFLRGTCQVSNCPFSHRVSKETMPVCSYFLKGVCTREQCPYLHVNVNKDAAVCEDFAQGFCPRGDQCKKKHVTVCPDFRLTGRCPRGKRCPLKHVAQKATAARQSRPAKKATQTRTEQRPKAKNVTASQQMAPPVEDEDDINLPMRERTLPAFIALERTPVAPMESKSRSGKEAGSLVIKPLFLTGPAHP